MNNDLQVFAREEIKKGLSQCNEGQRNLFRIMYANNKPELTMAEIVDAMPKDKLDWAMQQVKRTLTIFE